VRGTTHIDKAYEKLVEIKGLVPPEDGRPITDNEAVTRLRLIDPMLTEVLGWPRADISAEQPAGGGRLDYVIFGDRGVCCLVLEAKKRDLDLLSRDGPQKLQRLKLHGPVLKPTCWPIASQQMAEYIGRFMPSFGVLTNGEQWVGFLGQARPRGLALEDSYAAAFRSLDAIANDFEQFYRFFSREGVTQRGPLRVFLAPEHGRGVVGCAAPTRVVPPDEERNLSYQDREAFYDELRRAMDVAFRPILNDPDALASCFVESAESRAADSRLQRLATELREVLKSASADYPRAIRAEVERGRGDDVTGGAAAADTDMEGAGYFARLLGEPSAGKSVFLRRFYNTKLADMRDKLALIWIDGEKLSPITPERASEEALDQLKHELFGKVGPTWEQYREVYKHEWRSCLALHGLPEGEAQDLRRQFISERMEAERRATDFALRSYMDFAARNRQRLACVVIDNIDHGEVEVAVAWAVSVHLNSFALTTIALEDTTLWRLRARHADQAAAHSPDQFWLYRPKVRQVLENRCRYLKSVLSGQVTAQSGRARTRVGRRGQWEWSVDPADLVRVVNDVLLSDQDRASWIGAVCNHNIRAILDLCRQIVLSPHIKAEHLLATHATGRPISRWSVLKAIIAPTSEQYRGSPSDVVMNIFGSWHDDSWAPLLPARALALLRYREDQERNRKEQFPGFVATSHLSSLLQTHLGVPDDIARALLEKLLVGELVETYDPARMDLRHPDTRIKITPRGRLHLDWALNECTYVRLMAEVDPLVDREAAASLRARWNEFLQAVRSVGPGAASAEAALVREYVAYLLHQAERISPAPDHSDMLPVQELEAALRQQWVS